MLAGHGASGGEPHWRAGGDPAQPLQKVTTAGGAPESNLGDIAGLWGHGQGTQG